MLLYLVSAARYQAAGLLRDTAKQQQRLAENSLALLQFLSQSRFGSLRRQIES